MLFAFVLHVLGAIATLVATGFESLFAATVLMGLGNGMVEAVCNPLVASSYPNEKVKMLNRFHLWWPAGIVTGSILGYLVMDLTGESWQVMVALLFIPIAVYGYLLLGQKFPVTERVEMGVSHADSFRSLFTRLYLFIGLWLLTTASGSFVFVAAAVFAVGITFFWPTTRCLSFPRTCRKAVHSASLSWAGWACCRCR